MNIAKQRGLPFTWILALLISGIALTAGLSMWGLRKLYHRQYHLTATSEVLEMGTAITVHLSEQPEVKTANEVQSWNRFENLLQSLYTVEHGLQYVAVTEDGVVLFHRQAGTQDARQAVLTAADAQALRNDVRLQKKTLRLGTNDVPVVTFTKNVTFKDGTIKSIEIALREDTFARAASGPVTANTSMFHVAVVTVAVAFGFCVTLVLWVMRREDAAEQRRREQEHLAFAGAIASGVVHDFRNPLSSVKLDIQMLREETESGKPWTMKIITDLAEHATHTAGRMEELLDQFLSLSTPQEEAWEQVDLAATVAECLRMLQPRMTRHGILVNTDIPSRAVLVHAYATSLRRAILNILANAEQHSPNGGWIAIRLHPVKNRAILDVEDSGPGVPRADWKRVFEMFVSGRPGGTGLGLFLAKTAVEKCGGSIEVVEAERGGCCFRITLALVQE